MTNFSDMLSKAKAMQEKMKEAQEQIKKIEVEGEAGGNLVKVVLTGDYELKSIIISDTAKKESQEIINDLIIAAYNNAKENLKNSKMKVVDYFGPKVAKVKLSEHDSETLYKYCLEAQEPYNSKLLQFFLYNSG